MTPPPDFFGPSTKGKMMTTELSLTPEERIQVIGWLKEYPKGVPSNAWGFGPMAKSIGVADSFPNPRAFDAEIRAAYG